MVVPMETGRHNTTSLSHRWRWRRRPRIDFVVFVSLLLLNMLMWEDVGGEAGEDWSRCPRQCKCKWISGKRTAECQSAGFVRLPKFPMPDKIQVLHMNNNPLVTLKNKAFVEAGLINVQKVYLTNCSLDDVHPGREKDDDDDDQIYNAQLAMGNSYTFLYYFLLFLLKLSISKVYGVFYHGNLCCQMHKIWSPKCLSKITGTFTRLVILIELDLSHNQLRSLHPGTFEGNIRIRKLWLNSNPLRSLPQV